MKYMQGMDIFFKRKICKRILQKQSWYRENPYFKGTLTDIETYNIELIKSRE